MRRKPNIDLAGNNDGFISGGQYSNYDFNQDCEEQNAENDNIEYPFGDMDCDGDIDMSDAQIIMNLFTGVLDYNNYIQQIDCD